MNPNAGMFPLLSLAASVSICLCLFRPSTAFAASPALRGGRSDKIAITSRTDKTAIWTGDLLAYTVQLVYEPDIEFVMDYLDPEKLSLSPFIVRSVAFEERAMGNDKKTLEITFVLSAYETGKNELAVPAFTLFYFKKEPGFRKTNSQESVAQTVRVPPFPVGLRSTLSGGDVKLRDFRPVARNNAAVALSALTVGVLGMIGVAGIGGRNARHLLYSRRRKGPRRASRRTEAKLVQKRLAAIQALRHGSDDDLQRFFVEAGGFLRDLLRQPLNRETSSLTAEEIENALQGETFRSWGAGIKAVLDDCDRVRYGRDGASASRELSGRVSEALEKISRNERGLSRA